MAWHPFNKYCWDFWFAWHEGTLHVFYLQADRLACAYNPDRRHNQASIGHAIMTPYGWQELDSNQPALAHSEDGWDSLAIWTGSIIAHAGRNYLIYSARRRGDALIDAPYERRLPQNIGIATSDDLQHWKRTSASEQGPVIPNPGTDSKFDGINWRDPYVIRDEIDGQFYAFICTHLQGNGANSNAAIAFATSPDLENWNSSYSILYTTQEFYLAEVPQVFWRRFGDYSRLYLVFSPHWSPFFAQKTQVGITYYVRSQPIHDRANVSYSQIPWEDESANLLSDGLFAGKLIDPDTAEYPAFFGFQKEDPGGHFVGGISDPHWITFDRADRMHLSRAHPNFPDLAAPSTR